MSSTKGGISLEHARWSLAKIWFIGAGVFSVILIVQSFGTIYEGQISEVWSWALPCVMPTLSLIIAVLKSTAVETDADSVKNEPTVKQEFFRLASWLSIFYIVLLVGSILSAPLVSALNRDEKFKPFDAMKLSNLWLGPIQGVVVGCIGALFFQKANARQPARRQPRKPPVP